MVTNVTTFELKVITLFIIIIIIIILTEIVKNFMILV